jgi:hypothetical protein
MSTTTLEDAWVVTGSSSSSPFISQDIDAAMEYVRDLHREGEATSIVITWTKPDAGQQGGAA